VDFINKLIADAFEPQLLVLATTNRPAFVLSAVLENPQLASQAASLKAKLKPLLSKIIAASSSAPVVPVTKKEDEMEDDTKPAKFVKKNAPTYSAHSTTNAGVTLLSKLLQGLPTDKHPSAAQGKKGAAASANNAAAAATPATPAAKPTGAAAKSAKKASAAAAAAVEEDESVKMESDSAATAAPVPAVAPSPARTHRRQWTHTDLDGNKQARLRRSVAPEVPEGNEEEAETAPVAKTPAKAKATPAKKATAKKSAKKPASAADDMDD